MTVFSATRALSCRHLLFNSLASLLLASVASAQSTGTVAVRVLSDDAPVAGAVVKAGSAESTTSDDGTVFLTLAPGRVDVVVTKPGYDPAAAVVEILAGAVSRLDVAMEAQSDIGETIIVSATRSERRIDDVPLRVEVVAEEEVQEKIAMAPGDVSMLLAETNGLRVQTTSPAIGSASVRIQGFSGRYSQVLADGLPLYGQAGSISILQIPPMDLAQVEVIKGVASALYGMSAIGGVVNLVSRRPTAGSAEREFLFNRTSHRGTDAALWVAQSLNERWGFSVLGGTHWQSQSDLDDDGWSDLPQFKRFQVRPRLLWDTGAGRSLLVSIGATREERRGGTTPGTTPKDGRPYVEGLDTTRVDGGAMGRFLLSGGRVLAVRGSAMAQNTTHRFGEPRERNRLRTWFGEGSVTGTSGAHTWVGGVALQRDSFRALDASRFDYTFTAPALFAQDDYVFGRRVTLSGSARVDVHNEFGTFVSPRVSALLRATSEMTLRFSAGRGHVAPTPFVEESEATGLRPLVALGELEAERADSASVDATWRRAPLDITATVFLSRIRDSLMFRESDVGPYAAAIVNAETPTRTRGTELIARFHEDDLDIILTHMYVWSTEASEHGRGRREVPLNPRHTASFDILWELGRSALGFEAFYTGRQVLDDNPFRTHGAPYVLWGVLFTHRIGPALVFVNTENLGDVRQTRKESLLLATPRRDGRRTTDAWAPLDGRTLNAGLRFRF